MFGRKTVQLVLSFGTGRRHKLYEILHQAVLK